MKTLILLAALLLAVTIGGTVSLADKTSSGKKHRAVTQFNQPVRLQGVMLKGEYLFVHDDAAMARGETCSFVYKGTAEIAANLVVSFHCTPAQRAKVTSFTVRTEVISPGLAELKEFQFAGDTESHVVPKYDPPFKAQ